ncbi:AzlD family protein [Rhizobium sp. SSA_523]|uniref:AzlD family protein n=1 Tax=Rhizobium sp. SSA_523 TaxID=2952477 RepID=UPI0020901C59|nr:AzlD domain-containing protein [Rhizobium sp. SSA_523]MCO5730783.1 AzlD domain-containing protein [Rhizobium sp. SSA_523]WKC24394.1 AzlD domain-containing protein [Rhizobium sp. SSA_523]
MTIDPASLAAILAMMAATVFTRLIGAMLVNRFTLTPRMEKALTAVPPAVLMAVVTPTAIATGIAETLACAVTALAALRLPLLPAAGLGVLAVALLRAAGL